MYTVNFIAWMKERFILKGINTNKKGESSRS